MRVRQFRLLIAGDLPEAAADVLFDRADDLCVELLPSSRASVAASVFDGLPGGFAASAGVFDGLPGGLAASAGEFDGPPGGLASATASGGGGVVAWVAFDRPAPTLIDAVVSGVRDLDAAGLAVEAAIADDPLVTQETIAERLDRPVAAVRSWDLPGVVAAHPRRPVYDWPEVAEWLAARMGLAVADDEATLEAVTLTLRARALAPRLERLAPLRSLLL